MQPPPPPQRINLPFSNCATVAKQSSSSCNLVTIRVMISLGATMVPTFLGNVIDIARTFEWKQNRVKYIYQTSNVDVFTGFSSQHC